MGFSSETARDRQREVWREVKKEALTWRDVCRERQRNRGERERVSGAIKREREEKGEKERGRERGTTLIYPS